jgi:hypothetical protein
MTRSPMKERPLMRRDDCWAARLLTWFLRLLGVVDLAAVVAVVMPRSWMQWGCVVTGLASFPDEPLAGYLARSASAMYAIFGVLFIAMATDVEHYRRLIRLTALLAILLGLALIIIDLAEGMPVWWTLVEGPFVVLTGAIILVLQGRTVPPGFATESVSSAD